MKRIVIGVLAAIVLTMGSGFAWAEEEHHGEKGAAEQGTEVEVGVKVWWNKWKRSGPENFTTDSTFLVGPVAEVKFGNNLFLEASALASTSDYEATFLEGTELRNMKSDRHDVDVAAGLMITHYVGAFVGYRNSEIRDEVGGRETVYGAFLGIRGEVPLTEGLSLYGRATYLMNELKEEQAGEVLGQNSPGWIFEGGAKYELGKHIAASLGYQYEKTRGVDTGVSDEFSGVTLGAVYVFE
jgi:opacity protein-like surface antigen